MQESSVEVKAGGFVRRALRHRDFRLLLGASAISASGDWLYSVGLLVYVFDTTGSPGWVAAATFVRLLPYVVLGGLGGALADRYGGPRFLVAGDLTRVALMGGMTVAALVEAPALVILALATLTTAVATAYQPAVAALTPAAVGDEDLAAANSVSETVQNLALLAGPAIGGLLLAFGPPALAFAVNGATFLLAAALVVRLRTHIERDPQQSHEGLVARLVSGGRAMLESRDVVLLVALVSGGTFVYGAELVLWVLVSEQLLGTGSEGVGYMLAAIGVGGLVAGFWTARLADDKKPGRTVFVAAFCLGLPLASLAVLRNPFVVYAVLLVEGAATIVLDVLVITTLQRVLGPRRIAKVFGILDAVAVGTTLLGTLVASLVVDVIGVVTTVLVMGLSMPVLALGLSAGLRGISTRANTRREQVADRVALLRRVRLLDGASPQAVEAVAGAMTRVEVVSEQVLVEQGAKADDLFVIAEGSFEVLVTPQGGGDPERVAQLGSGEYFGEIALLRDGARTATVRATQPGLVYQIPGERFRTTVQALSSLPAALSCVMTARLTETQRIATAK